MKTLPEPAPEITILPHERLERIQLFRELSRPLEPIPCGVEPRPPIDIPSASPARAVFFDVYGTLVLSAAGEIAKDGDLCQADDPVCLALNAEGLHLPGANWQSLLAIIRSRHAAARARGVDFPEVDILDVWREMMGGIPDERLIARLAVRCEAAANPCWPEPGLATLLASLKAKQIPAGIISNAQFYTRDMLEAFLGMPLNQAGIDPELEVWSYREGRAKPSHQLYQTAANKLKELHGIAAADALMVGNDMRNDIAPAQAAGFRGVLYAGDRRSLRLRADDPALSGIFPFSTVTSLAQVTL